MAALSAAQRTTVRNAFIALADSNTGFRKGGAITSAQWADRWMADLDAYRSKAKPRGHYTMRVQPWIASRLSSLSTTIRTAITTHCNGG